MSQQEEDPSHYTRTLVVKPALSEIYDQLLPKSKSLETACKNHCTHTSATRHVSVPRYLRLLTVLYNKQECFAQWIWVTWIAQTAFDKIQSTSQSQASVHTWSSSIFSQIRTECWGKEDDVKKVDKLGLQYTRECSQRYAHACRTTTQRLRTVRAARTPPPPPPRISSQALRSSTGVELSSIFRSVYAQTCDFATQVEVDIET